MMRILSEYSGMICSLQIFETTILNRGAEYAGSWEPGSQALFLPGTFCEKMKSAWKGVEVKDTFLPGTFCEKKKSALKGAEVKNTFLPGTFCEKMKSA